MVTLLLNSAQLDVVLSPAERALSFTRETVRVDRADIARIQLTDNPWTWLRGVPSPGSRLRGILAMGTWRSATADDFVILRRKLPAVVIDLVADTASPFRRMLLTTRHGGALASALHLGEESGESPRADVGSD